MGKGLTLEFPLRSIERMLYKSKFGKVIGSVSGEMVIDIEKLPKSITESEFGENVNVAVVEYILTGTQIISRSGFKFTIQTGSEYVSLEFTSEHLLSVNVSVPIEIAKLQLKDLPVETGAEGSVSLEIILEILFIPNYRSITKRGARKAIKQAAKSVKNVVTKSAKGVHVAVQFGLKALSKPLMMYLDSLGRKLAIKAIKLGSQTAALKSIIRGYAKWLGRAAGVGGIVLDAYLIVQEELPKQVDRRGRETFEYLANRFTEAYANMLSIMTDSATISKRDGFHEIGGKIQRIVGNVPDMLKVYYSLLETGELKKPDVGAHDWIKKIEKSGPTFTQADTRYIDMVWEELFSEAFNTYWAFKDWDAYSNKKKRGNAYKMIQHANHLASAAGLAAAYHDILTFIVASGIYEDDNGQIDPDNIWEDWDGVMLLHHDLYGKNRQDRWFKYQKLAKKQRSLKPILLPFG